LDRLLISSLWGLGQGGPEALVGMPDRGRWYGDRTGGRGCSAVVRWVVPRPASCST